MQEGLSILVGNLCSGRVDHSDCGSDSLKLCSGLVLSLSSPRGTILLFLDAQSYLLTLVSEICVVSTVITFVEQAVRVCIPYLRNKGSCNASAKLDQTLQVRDYLIQYKKRDAMPAFEFIPVAYI